MITTTIFSKMASDGLICTWVGFELKMSRTSRLKSCLFQLEQKNWKKADAFGWSPSCLLRGLGSLRTLGEFICGLGSAKFIISLTMVGLLKG